MIRLCCLRVKGGDFHSFFFFSICENPKRLLSISSDFCPLIPDRDFPAPRVISRTVTGIFTPPCTGRCTKGRKKGKLLVQRTSPAVCQEIRHQLKAFSPMILSFSFQRWRKPTPIVVRRPLLFLAKFPVYVAKALSFLEDFRVCWAGGFLKNSEVNKETSLTGETSFRHFFARFNCLASPLSFLNPNLHPFLRPDGRGFFKLRRREWDLILDEEAFSISITELMRMM